MTPGGAAAAVLLLLLGEGALGHVNLVFPPARSLDLDFLDNVRTKPPCGMPKGERKRHFFLIGARTAQTSGSCVLTTA